MLLIATTACSSTASRTPQAQTRTAHAPAMLGNPPPPVTSERVQTIASVPFARVSWVVSGECQNTADAVNYAIPCPTLLPLGIDATSPVHGCRFAIVAQVGWPGCSDVRPDGWFFGSGDVSGPPGGGDAGFQHLILFGAPRVITDPARAVDGPAVYPQRVLPRGTVRIGRTLMRWYLVPPDNPSAFRRHLVLLWTTTGHTYVYGFHVTSTVAVARALDLELVNHLTMVAPNRAR